MNKIKKLFSIVYASFTVAACQDSISVDDVSQLQQQGIINGSQCVAEQAKTTVAMFMEVEFVNGKYFTKPMCTGTLIAPDTVVLAAHCLNEAKLRFELVRAGRPEPEKIEFGIGFETDLSRYDFGEAIFEPLPANAIRAVKKIEHPSSNEFQNIPLSELTVTEYDIGLLFLEKPVLDVIPEVVLSPNESSAIATDAQVSIAGYGQITQDGAMNVKMCASSKIGAIGPSLMHIGPDISDGRKCHGDSGGPTYMTIATDDVISQRIIGITSRAFNNETDCRETGGVDTRIDYFYDWLDEEMKQACQTGERTWCVRHGVLTADEVSRIDQLEPEAQIHEGPIENEGDISEGEIPDEIPSNVENNEIPNENSNFGCQSGCSSGSVNALFWVLLIFLSPFRRR